MAALYSSFEAAKFSFSAFTRFRILPNTSTSQFISTVALEYWVIALGTWLILPLLCCRVHPAESPRVGE